VTSKPYGDPKAIQLTDVDLVAGSLQVVSYARPEKLFTANRNLIVAQVALLKPEFFKKVVEAIVDILYASFN
jgi:mRNA interferase MazF